MNVPNATRLRLFSGAVLLCVALAAYGCHRDEACEICAMSISPGTRAVVDEGGRRRVVCDPRCALTYQQQTGTPVSLREVRDFDDRRPISPSNAYYVTGSDTAPDARTTAMTAWPSDPAQLQWHRCVPSVLAFRGRERAERFSSQHGGRVVTLAELGFKGR